MIYELDFVQNNSCWWLGNGKKIQIWKHRWIQYFMKPPIPKQGCKIHLQYTFVHQLFNQDNKTWNINLLRELFDLNTVNIISGIQIHYTQEDRLVWLLEKNGAFSVKSAYRKMYEEQNTSKIVGPRMIKIYKIMWKLPLLPRIKHFLWKAVSILLPTRDFLSTKVPGVVDVCPLCDQETPKLMF